MKKIILLLAVVFVMSSFTTSNTGAEKISTIETEQILKSTNFVDFKECTIKIKGTFDGKEIDIEVTIEADDCATAAGKMLKAVM